MSETAVLCLPEIDLLPITVVWTRCCGYYVVVLLLLRTSGSEKVAALFNASQLEGEALCEMTPHQASRGHIGIIISCERNFGPLV